MSDYTSEKLYDLSDGGDHMTLTAEEVADHVDATPNEELRALVEEWREDGQTGDRVRADQLEAVIDDE